MNDGNDYTPTREQIIGAACSWFDEYGIDGVDLSNTDIGAMVERGLRQASRLEPKAACGQTLRHYPHAFTKSGDTRMWACSGDPS
jgi:hypothetical protein